MGTWKARLCPLPPKVRPQSPTHSAQRITLAFSVLSTVRIMEAAALKLEVRDSRMHVPTIILADRNRSSRGRDPETYNVNKSL